MVPKTEGRKSMSSLKQRMAARGAAPVDVSALGASTTTAAPPTGRGRADPGTGPARKVDLG
ncbi:hypothetical protein COU20_01055 [Candidatus Kaiserbacteria bacterium CG10_big_fil_rev_8_21_14_0_10_59_10]|uniref:Uncharacterized protein n=1 Tax=Candidatus Kaiserbacteria bacterium CG10_big_fil_rev_8_21_14_0_10_59_10 TaxID=1974612 RepID=A0A2H0U8D4_9BACT|nr:MAG: hypothetical protein COU20_01055 [Candidatus Kaiserbacteria bacterium CG10_big_fil_rev_8_21_14_0_10_59_10]